MIEILLARKLARRYRSAGRLLNSDSTSERAHARSADPAAVSLPSSFAALLMVSAIVLLLSAAPALAIKEYVPGGAFGEPGTEAGQLERPGGIGLSDGGGSAGDVYVADRGNARVDEFSAAGVFMRAWGWGVATGLPKLETCELICQAGVQGSGSGQFREPGAVAVDNSTDPSHEDVYVSDQVSGPETNDRIEKFSADGAYLGDLTGTCKEEGEFPPSCAGFTPFKVLAGLAVDLGGDLWVYGQAGEGRGLIAEFDDAGRYLKSYTIEADPDSEFPAQIAIDARDDIYVANSAEAVYEYTMAGAQVGEVFYRTQALSFAVNPTSNNLLIDSREERKIEEFPPFFEPRTPIQTFPSDQEARSPGIAVDGATGTTYATESSEETSKVERFDEVLFPTVVTDQATNVNEDSMTLNGSVDPEGEAITKCEFEYGPEASEPGDYPNREVPCSPAAPVIGNVSVPVSATVHGLAARHTYHYRLSAVNQNGARSGKDGTAFTVTGPVVEGGVAANVAATEVTLSATLDAAGLPTTYHVEYGTSEAYGQSTPEQSIGALTEPTSVSVRLTSLRPDVEYHFRFVATNELGVARSERDTTFSTAASTGGSSSSLPDGRAYELVSNSGGATEVYPPRTVYAGADDIATPLLFRAAEDGNAVAYIGETSSTGGTGALGEGQGDQWLARRDAGGWQTEVITPVGSEAETQFQAFSGELATGILQSNLQPPLAVGAPACDVLYSRLSTSGAYQTLFTTIKTPGECGRPLFAGASAGESQVIFQSEAAITDEAPATTLAEGRTTHGFYEGCESGCDLYESNEGRLRLVNILPNGEKVTSATFGGFSPEARRPDFSNVISTDASRIFWTDTQTGASMGHVYVLENGSDTVQVSGSGAAQYWTATPDGRYAYYTEDGVLWRFDTDSNTREKLEAEGTSEGEGAGVQGVIGVNDAGEDGAYVYFVAQGKLASNKREFENAAGEPVVEEARTSAEDAATGEVNLYEREGEVTRFIAVLAPQDDSLSPGLQQQAGDWAPGLAERTAEVTPDGHDLVFESRESLTGYANLGGTVEVFVYDSEGGKLACASCDPAGTPQHVVPGYEGASPLRVSANNTALPRWISDDGSRVFFDTNLPLVSQDENGQAGVYEWEREGGTSCPTATSRYGGCVFSLSGAESPYASLFVEASANGDDVFFTHRGQLVPGANGEVLELYDAHVCSSAAPCPTEVSSACVGSGCQGAPPAPPSFASPPSATFSGVGNYPPSPVASTRTAAETKAERLTKALKACRRDRKKAHRVACERRARIKFGAKKTPSKHSKKGRQS
jgi:hypothetical protein